LTAFRSLTTLDPMLGWYRARIRSLAAGVLLSFVTLGASSAVPHDDDCHESLCVLSIVPHDASQHGIRSESSPAEQPLHCVVCHWVRLLRPSVEVVREFAPAANDDGRVASDVIGVPLVALAAQPPLRSPPYAPARIV
jgi:hypothetical protein